MVQYLIQWNFTNTCPLLVSEICLDIYATRYIRCTCFCNKICQCWSCNSIYHHFCIWFRLFRFSVHIFLCRKKFIVRISKRRYPYISPFKSEDKYSWRSIFVDSHLSPPAMVHGRLRFTAQKLKSLQYRFSWIQVAFRIDVIISCPYRSTLLT